MKFGMSNNEDIIHQAYSSDLRINAKLEYLERCKQETSINGCYRDGNYKYE